MPRAFQYRKILQTLNRFEVENAVIGDPPRALKLFCFARKPASANKIYRCDFFRSFDGGTASPPRRWRQDRHTQLPGSVVLTKLDRRHE